MSDPRTPREWLAKIRADLEAMERPPRPLPADRVPLNYNEPPPTAEQLGVEADPSVAYPYPTE